MSNSSGFPTFSVSMHNSDDLPVFPSYRLFDIWLNALTLADIRMLLLRTIESERKILLANQNLHSFYLCTQDATVRAFFESADYTHIDGTSLIVLGKLMGLPFSLLHRCGYMDLFPKLLPTIIENEWRIFYLGSKAEVLDAGLERLRGDYPGLQIAGHHGYFDKSLKSPDNEALVRAINEYSPHILFVGMGMPTQERWILEQYPVLKTNVVLHCGGMMDYLAGAIPTPPRWLGPIGLEWAFRLLSEPLRLWKRYTIEPFQLLGVLLHRRFRRKSSSSE